MDGVHIFYDALAFILNLKCFNKFRSLLYPRKVSILNSGLTATIEVSLGKQQLKAGNL